jgi:hypothetical protein
MVRLGASSGMNEATTEIILRRLRVLLAEKPKTDPYYLGVSDSLNIVIEEIRNVHRLAQYKKSHGVENCQCGLPITQDSCPKCGVWHDIYGRR